MSKMIQIAFHFRTFKALFLFGCDKGGWRDEHVEYMFGSVYLKVWVRMGERIENLFSSSQKCEDLGGLQVSKTIQITFYFRTFKTLFVSGCDKGGGRASGWNSCLDSCI